MNTPDSFYVAITKDYAVHRIANLENFKFRNDIVVLFQAVFRKRTEHNVFFNYLLIDKDGKEIESNELVLHGLNCSFLGGESWMAFKRNISGKVLRFDIEDLLKQKKTLRFHNYPDDTTAFETFISYVNDLNRLGTHQAVSEVTNLKEKVQELTKKIEKLKGKK